MGSAGRKFLLCALLVIFCALNISVVFASDIKLSSSESPATAALAGRRVPSPQRIVSINLCTDELLLRLVGPERVAALTKFSTDPEVSTVAVQAKDIRQTQGDIEHVLACGPDMVLGGRFSNQETVRFFERSGTPVLVFKVPKSFEDIYSDIRRLAAAVGEKAKGEEVIKQMQDELAVLNPDAASGVKSRGAEIEHRELAKGKRAVFYQSDNYVPGLGTFENAVMEAAGLRNVAVELGIRDYGRMGLEELIRARPDVIIFSSEQKKSKTVRGEVLDHPAIKKALPEVKTVTIPTLYLNCGSPVSVEAVRILVKETNR